MIYLHFMTFVIRVVDVFLLRDNVFYRYCAQYDDFDRTESTVFQVICQTTGLKLTNGSSDE
jgi:hypothetical protein